jgi:hypothetical protein
MFLSLCFFSAFALSLRFGGLSAGNRRFAITQAATGSRTHTLILAKTDTPPEQPITLANQIDSALLSYVISRNRGMSTKQEYTTNDDDDGFIFQTKKLSEKKRWGQRNHGKLKICNPPLWGTYSARLYDFI